MPEQLKGGRGSRLFLACILGFLAAMGPLCTDFYLPALPRMAAVLQGNPAQMQLSITACLLGLSLGQILVGPISDSRGRKRPLLLSLLVFIIAGWFCSRSAGVAELVCWRFVQGLAGSGGVVLSRAIACDLYRGSELTKFFALLMLVNGIAPIAGPLVGSGIMAFSDWTGIFLFLAAAGVCQFLLVLFGCPETLPAERRASEGVLRSAGAMFGLLRNRAFVCYMMVQGAAMFGFFGYIASSPFVLQGIYGFSTQGYSVCFGAIGAGIMLFSHLTGRMSASRGDRSLLFFGLSISMAASAVLLAAAFLRLPAAVMLPAMFVFASCIGITMTTSFSLAIRAQQGGAGGAAGLLGVVSFVSGALSSPLVGLGGEGTAVPFAVAAAASSAAALWFFRRAGGDIRY